MKAMILAAGLGTRMRPLTEHTPKPLLPVAGKPLLEYHIERLVAAGISELVINVSHLGQQIIDYCGDGSQWGASIQFSAEPEPLETAGGIVQALPLLGDEPFLVVNGDIWTDYPLERLCERRLARAGAHLVMVANPAQHPQGDFLLDDQGLLQERPQGRVGLTFSGIGLYSAEFFAELSEAKTALRPLFMAAIQRGRLAGEFYEGAWQDIGTPERLAELNEALAASK